MLKVSIIENYLIKSHLYPKSQSSISFCRALDSPKLLFLCGCRSGLKGDLLKNQTLLCQIPR